MLINSFDRSLFTWKACFIFFSIMTSHAVYSESDSAQSFQQPDEKCLTVEVFSDVSCPHCKRAYEFLYKLQLQYPDIEIITKDLAFKSNRSRFVELNKQYKIDKPGTPSFLICNNFLVGFDDADHIGIVIQYLMGLTDRLPTHTSHQIIKLPLLGSVSVDRLGLPLFTIMIGLVDGFNPCAMWVLLFLLSLLLNIKDRKKILLIAGTFVFISGAVYFAFMAAWLNIFLVIGLSRTIQLVVGMIAIFIGTIHIKDYFAFQKGFSLSIPDSVKPRLFANMRKIIYAENMMAALLGVAAIAILVNLVELICTAGLPAVYTQILTLREMSMPQYYGYLLLYNIAYIADDALMVTIVVYTFSSKKMQETHGRRLKLVSGLVIIVLGILLLVKPGWLL